MKTMKYLMLGMALLLSLEFARRSSTSTIPIPTRWISGISSSGMLQQLLYSGPRFSLSGRGC